MLTDGGPNENEAAVRHPRRSSWGSTRRAWAPRGAACGRRRCTCRWARRRPRSWATRSCLTERARARVRAALLAPGACRHGLGEVTAAEVDALGLGEARRLVFERALDDYAARHPDAPPTRLVVDGTLFRAWRGVPHACVPRADATVPCAAAASVLAKTTRDAQVLAACEADPALDERYALRGNKGYLSAAHVAGLRAHGYDARHRRSYRIRALGGGGA